jgi:exopolysaccharide production protein ExoZ
MLEFASGLCLGWLGLRNRRLPVGFAAVAFLAGFAAILFIPPALPRLLCWGVPATLIAAGAVGLDPVFRAAALGWLRPLGDASYSIYLTHSFVIAALGVALGRWMPSSLYSFPVAIIAGCLFSAAVGLMAYRVVELPLLNAVAALRSKPVLSGLPDGPAELAFPATTSLNKADAEQ